MIRCTKIDRSKEEKTHSDTLGVVPQITVLGVGLGSSGVADGGADDAGKTSEDGLGSPEAPEGKDGSPQGPLARRRQLRDPIREPDAHGLIRQGSKEEGDRPQQEEETASGKLHLDFDCEPFRSERRRERVRDLRSVPN